MFVIGGVACSAASAVMKAYNGMAWQWLMKIMASQAKCHAISAETKIRQRQPVISGESSASLTAAAKPPASWRKNLAVEINEAENLSNVIMAKNIVQWR
jgi:hypothetical protein